MGLGGRIARLEAGSSPGRCPACGLLSAEPIRYGLIVPDAASTEPTRCRRCGTALAATIKLEYVDGVTSMPP